MPTFVASGLAEAAARLPKRSAGGTIPVSPGCADEQMALQHLRTVSEEVSSHPRWQAKVGACHPATHAQASTEAQPVEARS